MPPLIRTLIVDDSAFVRKVMRQMLARSPFIEVVGAAKDGLEALELVEQLRPDVVTLDLNMPNGDGLTFLRTQMARRPLPVIVVTMASKDGLQVLSALEAGAVDVVQKPPTALANDRLLEISDDLVQKVKKAATADLRTPAAPHALESSIPRPTDRATRADILVIGISTGGPQALKYLLPRFDKAFPVPVAIVLHMPVGYTELYARSLNEACAVNVAEAREGDIFSPGSVLLAPAGHHMTLVRKGDQFAVHLDLDPLNLPHRPSVDVLFKSAAEVCGARVLGVVMTGMGSDGTQGAAWIKAQGGRIIVESEESCVVYGMPRAVIEAGVYDRSVALGKMADTILEMI